MPDFFSPEYIIGTLLSVPAIIFAFSFKGFGQALVSKWLGDPTPEDSGRLTLNPLAHINWIGLVCMMLFGFGWMKPMPTNSRYYKHYKRDTVIFCLSGAISLVVLSFGFAMMSGLLSALLNAEIFGESVVFTYLLMIFQYTVIYPLYLALFYLLPLPGLDGYKIITTFTPYKWNSFLYKVERYSIFIFLGFILLMRLTNLSAYIFFPATLLSNLFTNVWSSFFGLFIH